MQNEYFAGCDVGSTTGKAVIIDQTGTVISSSLVASEIDPEETARLALSGACSKVAGLSSYKNLSRLVGTGYGRNEVPFADENISEISCHAMGAFRCNTGIRTIIDIGGQDMKAISISDDGSVLEFAMNDKCAAGTGRFYEAMARIFRMDLSSFSDLSLKARERIPVTSQCSVFAESEVVSLLAKKKPPADIAAGIQAAVTKRCFTLLKRVGIREQVTVTGGCAKNPGLLKLLAETLDLKITRLDFDPQLVGALGAAIFAMKRA